MANLDRHISIGFAAIGVGSMLVCALAYRAVQSFLVHSQWVAHTHLVLEQVAGLFSLVQDIEAGGRGFALTGDADFLEPYERAREQAFRQLDSLRSLVKDSEGQLRRLDRLDDRIRRRIELSGQTIRLRREQGLEAAAAVVARGEGQRTMDEIRELVGEIRRSESALLEERVDESRRAARGAIQAFLTLGGLVLAMLAVMHWGLRRDLTRRRHAEAALKESESRFRDLYNEAPCGYHSLDAHGVFVEINDTELRWLGYCRDEVVGHMRFPDLLTDEGRATFAAQFPKFMQRGHIEDLEFTLKRKDGTLFTVLLSAGAVRDERGHFLRSRSTMFDITDRKRAQDDLDRFFNQALDMMCLAGFDGYFKKVNPAFARTLGYSEEELLGRPFLSFVHPDDRASTELAAARLAEGGQVVGFENRYLSKDGSYRWISWSSSSQVELKLIYAVARDTTAQRAAEKMVRELNAELTRKTAVLEATNQELEAFSYSASHDLRAPLRSIDGFSLAILEDYQDRLDEQGRDYLARIRRATQRMADLIDDLTSLSRVSRGELQLEEVDVSRLATEVGLELRGREPGRAVELVVAEGLTAQADARLLRVALENLLANAWKFTGKTAHPRIEMGSENENGQRIFFVRDNGAGFEMKYADRLFAPFQRLHHDSEFPGTGVGLATVKRIIGRHGGRIWAQSEPGSGATFYFTV